MTGMQEYIENLVGYLKEYDRETLRTVTIIFKRDLCEDIITDALNQTYMKYVMMADIELSARKLREILEEHDCYKKVNSNG